MENKNVRYVEVKGERYAVGLGYLVELTRNYNQVYGGDNSIDEVLMQCFSNLKPTPDAIDKIKLGLITSINYYRERCGQELVDEDYIDELVYRHGFAYMGEALENIGNTLVGIIVKGNEGEGEGEQASDEQKKSSR